MKIQGLCLRLTMAPFYKICLQMQNENNIQTGHKFRHLNGTDEIVNDWHNFKMSSKWRFHELYNQRKWQFCNKIKLSDKRSLFFPFLIVETMQIGGGGGTGSANFNNQVETKSDEEEKGKKIRAKEKKGVGGHKISSR